MEGWIINEDGEEKQQWQDVLQGKHVISIYALLTALVVVAIAERESNRSAPKVDQNIEVSELQIRTYSVVFYLNAEGSRYLTV